eukprot:g16971.t1
MAGYLKLAGRTEPGPSAEATFADPGCEDGLRARSRPRRRRSRDKSSRDKAPATKQTAALLFIAWTTVLQTGLQLLQHHCVAGEWLSSVDVSIGVDTAGHPRPFLQLDSRRQQLLYTFSETQLALAAFETDAQGASWNPSATVFSTADLNLTRAADQLDAFAFYQVPNPCASALVRPVSVNLDTRLLAVASPANETRGSLCVFSRASLEEKFALQKAYLNEGGVTELSLLEPGTGETVLVLNQDRNSPTVGQELVVFTDTPWRVKNSVAVEYLSAVRIYNLIQVTALQLIGGITSQGEIQFWQRRANGNGNGGSSWAHYVMTSVSNVTNLYLASAPDGTSITMAAVVAQTDIAVFTFPVFPGAAVVSALPTAVLSGVTNSTRGESIVRVMVGRTVGGWDHYSIAALIRAQGSSTDTDTQRLRTLVSGNCPSSAYHVVPRQTMQSCASMCDHASACALAGWTMGNCSLSGSVETDVGNCTYPTAYSFTYKQESTPITRVDFKDADLDVYERGGEILVQFAGVFANKVELTFVNEYSEEQCAEVNGSNVSNCTMVDLVKRYPLCEIPDYRATDTVNVTNPDQIELDGRTFVFVRENLRANAVCYLDVNYVQNPQYQILLRPDFEYNVTKLEFRAVLVEETALLFASDTFFTNGEIMDNFLTWTGLTFTDTNPNCRLVGGNLLWGYSANFQLTDQTRNPLRFFGVYVIDGNSVGNATMFKIVSTASTPTFPPFEAVDTEEDLYSHWAIFAETLVGMHTHNALTKVFYDLGYQPKILNIRFPDADANPDSVGGCVVWDIQMINTTCLTHHEVWFRAPEYYMGGQYLSQLGTVNVSAQSFDIPKGTPMPVPSGTNVWYVVIKSGFVSKDLALGLVEARQHNEAQLVYTLDPNTNLLDWPKSYALDLRVESRNRNLFNDGLYAYPFPNALPVVSYPQIVGSPLSLEQWFSLLSAGSTHILMTEAMIEHQYLRNRSAAALPPEEVVNFFPVELDPDTDQCIVGAMLDPPLCWTQAHDSKLEYWTTPVPERRIECSVDMPGLRTTLQPLQYLCRYCTMEIYTAPNPATGLMEATTRAACTLSEREKCAGRIIDFSQLDVVPPPNQDQEAELLMYI